MLKLKYLFDNRNLAEMILKNWEYDETKLNLLNYYRISANAIYPFESEGNVQFLRFVPTQEKNLEQIQSELDFIRYLKSCNFPVVETVLSKKNNEIELVDTPWGSYFAVVFKRVKGKRLSNVELNEQLIFDLGKALGSLHKLSKEYVYLKNKRSDWNDILNWANDVLSEFPNESDAKKEVILLKEFFSKLPKTPNNYGLVHYDFESDNVFYDEDTNQFNIIDFDDCVYHWYISDVITTLESINEDKTVEQIKKNTNLFLSGYQSLTPLDIDLFKYEDMFKRYARLYGYVRCLRSMEESWDNEPDWMISLRSKLSRKMDERKNDFGKDI